MNHHYDPISGTLSLVLDGNLLSTNTAAVGSALCMAMEESKELRFLDWDLRQATMIDSAGLNLLISVVRAVNARGGRVRVQIGNPNVHRVMIFTRMDRYLEIIKAGEIASSNPAVG